MKTTLALLAALTLTGAEPAAAPAPIKEPFADPARAFELAKQDILQNYYRDDLTEADLYRAAVQGMLMQVDPKLSAYNQLLTPREHADLLGQLAGQLSGIGVNVRMEEDTGLVDVLETLAGSPAQAAGLVTGSIVTIDGRAFKGQSLADVVAAIRGPEGQSVFGSPCSMARTSSSRR